MKTHFDEAIGTVPPSTLDVDTLIARGRRGTAYRRMGVSAAGLGAVAALVAVVLGTGALDGIVATGRSGEFGGPRESVSQTERRLSQALQTIVGEKLPGARPSAGGGDPAVKALEVRHVYGSEKRNEHGGDGTAPADYFEARALLRHRTAADSFDITTGIIGPGFVVRTNCDDHIAGSDNAQANDCIVKVGQHGEKVVRVSPKAAPDSGRPRGTYRYVHISRADGTGIVLQAKALDISSVDTLPAKSDSPVLSLDLLEEIGTDPRLQFRP